MTRRARFTGAALVVGFLLLVGAASLFSGGGWEPELFEPDPSAAPSPGPEESGLVSVRPDPEVTRRESFGPSEPDPIPEELEEAVGEALPPFQVIVERANGQPLPHFRFDLLWRKGWGGFGTDELTTDAEGRARTTMGALFQLEGIDALHPELGLPIDVLGPSAFATRDDPRVFRLRVAPVGPVLIGVKDPRGHPVPGASVKVEPAWTAEADPSVTYLRIRHGEDSLTADEVGSVSVPLSAGTYLVEGSAPGFRGVSDVVLRADGGSTPQVLDLQLASLRPVKNREVAVEVTRPPGVGSPKLSLSRRAEPGGSRAPDTLVRPRVERIGDGAFVAHVPIEGTWILSGKARRGEDVRVELGPRQSSVRVAFEPRALERSVYGRVVAADTGLPLTADVSLHRGQTVSASERGRSGEDGSFQLDVRRQTRGYVRAQATGYAAFMYGPLDLPLEDPLALRLMPGLELRGQAVDGAGKPVQGDLYLEPSPAAPDGPSSAVLTRFAPTGARRAGTDPDGSFHFSRVPALPVRVRFVPEDNSLGQAIVTTQGGVQDLTIVLRPGNADGSSVSLSGRVTDRLTGRPLPAVCLTFGRVPESSSTSHVTGPDGRYVIHDLEPGQVNVHAAMGRELMVKYASETAWGAELRPGNNVLDFQLTPGHCLHLRVVDAYGEPVNRARLRPRTLGGEVLYFQDHMGHLQREDSADEDGRLDVHGMPPEPLVIQVWRSRAAMETAEPWEFQVRPTANSRDVQLLRLTDEEGARDR